VPRLSPVVRISLALMLLTTTILVTGELLGLTPSTAKEILQGRKVLCETLAVEFSSLAQKQDIGTISTTLESLVTRNDNILSAAVRSVAGGLLAEAGDHQENWTALPGALSTPTNAQVPVFQGDVRWGTVEVRFAPLASPGLRAIWENSLFRLVLFVAALGFVTYLLFMRRALRELDPTAVIPARVKYALDALAEGVILVDEQGEIVLANTVFAGQLEAPVSSVVGKKAAELKWVSPESGKPPEELPWLQAMREGKRQTGTTLSLERPSGGSQLLMVNGAPIVDAKGKSRGAVATFNDITELEKKNQQLKVTLEMLKESRDEVARQNQELKHLANSDALTHCLNRRAFFGRFERMFIKAATAGHELSCIMCDIDHFKSFNDRYGHAVGDKVLAKVAQILRTCVRNEDLICRYGGEEFCIVLPNTDMSVAIERAQNMRSKIEEAAGAAVGTTSDELVTSSLGVSTVEFGATDSAELLNQADMALYAAKAGGRNRVTLWDPSMANPSAGKARASQ